MASAAPVVGAGAGAPVDTCPHVNMVRKTAGYTVFKDECTQCFENDLSPTGVDLCLTCFNGGCTGANKHAARHHAVASHPIVLNIRKREVKKPDQPVKPAAAAAAAADATADAPAAAAKDKDTVVVKAEEPKYEYDYKCTCLTCKVELSLTNTSIAATVKQVQEAEAKAAADAIINLGGDGPIVACSHTANLKQVDKDKAPQIASKATAHCARCELGIKTGLWMCLTCGALGCARDQFGGTGGRSHGVAHNKDTGHPLVVKLDTIKPDKAEVFCYACGDMVDDSKHLQQHLATFGLVLSEQQSEGKTMAEILAAANNNLNLLSITDGGSASEAKELCFGPGFTGLENLGNTCYMASVAQVLFALPSFYKRYYIDGKEHIKTCRAMRPGECYQCQLSKIGCGLNSGEYSKAPVDWKGKAEQKGAAAGSGAGAAPVPGQGAVVMIKQDPNAASAPGDKRKPLEQHGIRPKAFRKVVAAGNPDFLSSKQQDAFEYLQHFIQQINQKERKVEDNPTTTFDFRFENRTQCGTCKRVKYQTEKATDVQLPVPVDQKALDAQNAQAKEQHLKNEADKKRREAEKVAREKAETAVAIAAVDAAVAKEVGAPVTAVGAAAAPADSAPAAPSTAGKPEDKPKPVELPPVQFEECVAEWAKAEQLERYNCPDCKSAQPATKATKFETFPETLIVQMRRFVQTDWTFRKLNVDVVVPKEFDFAAYLGRGLQANEQLMTGAAAPGAPAAPPKPDAAIVAQLESMGMFTKNACLRAAVAVKNASADAAMEWALAHGEDADINDPLPEPKPAAAPAPAGPAVPEELVQQVLMILEGLPVARVRHALQKTGNNVERAVDYAMSHMDEPLPGDEKAAGAGGAGKKPTAAELKSKFRLWAAITHQGAGPGTGHYVAHVLKEGKWCVFNDQRVTVEDKPKLEQAYILLFRKVA